MTSDLQRNVGGPDRAARAVLGGGLVLGAALLPIHRALAALAAATGGVLLETAISAYCPLNRALGLDTHRPRRMLSSVPT